MLHILHSTCLVRFIGFPVDTWLRLLIRSVVLDCKSFDNVVELPAGWTHTQKCQADLITSLIVHKTSKHTLVNTQASVVQLRVIPIFIFDRTSLDKKIQEFHIKLPTHSSIIKMNLIYNDKICLLCLFWFSLLCFYILIFFYFLFINQPWLPPSSHSINFYYFKLRCYAVHDFSIILNFSSTFLSFFKLTEGYFLLTFFYLLHNNLPSIVLPVVSPLLWGYSDLFTTLPPSLHFQSFIHPSSSLIIHHWYSHSSIFIICL